MATIDRDPIEQLAEEWRERLRRGEQFSAEEYAARYPELAGDIRDLFPAVVMMEELKPVAGDLTGVHTVATSPDGATPADGVRLERLGDFRILRVVGRGGMGVVYEAEQESLGRHVALKVLPAAVAQRPMYLERFRREARTAARLHHTNIVPVYGVGEETGSCYYAMQFIQGQALDVVIAEIKRLRGRSADDPVRGDQPTCDAAVKVAHSLVTGRFTDAEPAVSDEAAPAGPTVATPPTPSASDLGEQPAARYYRRVAHLGVQAAEGLAYAHAQGVLHRDIKPANLLLDAQGTLWITDFGLAKAEDSEDLTQAGDIVGTVRYMAPERFEGKADARSDIHALGVTLYELLALQPPFSGTDRASLIGQITAGVRPPLHALAPDVPRDLETIVLKAMARDPAARYASAAELADDLRRFLENRPIKARRISAAERFRRWCRRNPVVASLTAAVFLLLACFAVGSTVAAIWLQEERDAARAAEDRARAGEERARKEEEHARKAEEAKTEKLYQSYVDQARASRFSRQPGQRFASLTAIREAVRIARERNMPPDRFDELRNLAIACLALPDWRTLREWEALPTGTFHWDSDSQHRLYARTDRQGRISVRRIEDDVEIVPLTFVPGETWLAFSSDGRYLLARGGAGGRLRVWDLASPERRVAFDMVGYVGFAFHPDGCHLAVSYASSGGSIYQIDLTSAKQSPQLLAKLGNAPANPVAFNPAGDRVAVIQKGMVSILDVKTGSVVSHLPQAKEVSNLAWHPRGNFLALVSGPSIHVWDVMRQQRVSVLDGCRNGGIQVSFTPDGELLASDGWESRLRLWNWRTGQQVLRQYGGSNVRFTAAGHLIIVEGIHARLADVAAGPEYRSLVRQSNPAMDLSYWPGAIHPDGRLLALSMTDGVRMWDLQTGDEVGLIRMKSPAHIAFTASDGLLTNGQAGLLYWPVRRLTTETGLQFGPPKYWQSGLWMGIGCSKDGQVVVQARRNGGAFVLHRDRPERPVPLQPHLEVRGARISPDGQFAATFGFGAAGAAKLWEAKTGRFIKQLPVNSFTDGAFSPDGKWLAVRGENGARILRVGSWEQGFACEWAWGGGVCFSPDSRLLAVESGHGVIRLLDPATGHEKVRLEDPNQDPANWLGFTPDGTRLVASSDDGKAIHIWDLRLIREQLVELGLDWDTKPYPPAPAPQKVEPLRVTVVGAELANSPAAMLTWELQTYSLRLLDNPFDAEAYFQRGRIYLRMNNLVKAAAELNLALAFQAEHAGARFLRGKLHQQQGRWQQAIDDFTSLLARQPEDPELHKLRGACRVALGEHAAAAADYAEWLKHGDEKAITLNSLAWQLVGHSKERQRAELALPLIEKAVAQAPRQREIVHTLGVTYYRLDRYKEAIATLERAGKLPGPQPTASELYFLAMCRHRLGDAAGAKGDFDAAVRWQDAAKLPPARIEELKSFRVEAEVVLQEKAK
jgi:serine/threonine protein kinase/WD40 repeat protein/Flp pilus assembly protein TadD